MENVPVENHVAMPPESVTSSQGVSLPIAPSINDLWAAQQQQQALLLQLVSNLQANVATPAPTLEPDHAMPSGDSGNFRLTSYDPDSSGYSMTEWIDDANVLREELRMTDALMIHRVGEALRGRARDFVRVWRPLRRTWKRLAEDLTNAFPNQKAFGVLFREIAQMTSTTFKSFSEYGALKVRLTHRILPDLPWKNVLSLVEDGMEDPHTQMTLNLQQPANEAALFQLLSTADARRRDTIKRKRSPEIKPSVPSSSYRRPKLRNPTVSFEGNCFTCGKRGHRQTECYRPVPSVPERRATSTVTCAHCHKIGHKEENCWIKNKTLSPFNKNNNAPAKALLVSRRRTLYETPMATCVSNGSSVPATYVIDSGSELSLITSNVAAKLNSVLKDDPRTLTGVGTSIVYTSGTCDLILLLPTITIEATLHVIPERYLPDDLQMIIGWDIISRSGIQVQKAETGLELHHSLVSSVSRSLNIQPVSPVFDFTGSGLAERDKEELQALFSELHKQRPPHVTTGEMKITLLVSLTFSINLSSLTCFG